MKKLSHIPFIEDQKLIQMIKSDFLTELSQQLDLLEVQAPILTRQGDGIQDDLNGIEQPVSVSSKAMPQTMQVVHSLAKWKRQLLARADFAAGSGIVTQMRALRPDEELLSERHSICVDQWDWEKVITDQERSLDYLKSTVERIYSAMRAIDKKLAKQLAQGELLPETIHFVHSEELLQQYPRLTPKEREYQICKQYGAVFLIGIGGQLSDGSIHDGRAPDYDDWSSETELGCRGLNGDILVWSPVLEDAFELSSMGIRVSPEVMQQQLTIRGCEQRLDFEWHQQLMAGKLPQTIGGGIGQSRLAMFFLQKPHIGQVQFSIWPETIAIDLL
ncbi:aspartate--ammonia ligase [Kangiella sp. TOML190]|uniref:aspartate--ammonia ligase n=1 Tax=Kangiella sp. TOML190 TaxID=2931351 RepID=UPI00203F28F7|nr:aspartate--ammonia ligase [Kangiella sp. TOML190]